MGWFSDVISGATAGLAGGPLGALFGGTAAAVGNATHGSAGDAWSDFTNSFAGDIMSGIPFVGDVIGSNREREQQEYDRQWDQYVQETTWEREDNAVQRRAADMEKAGFNPLLAAGAPAQSGATVASSSQAPQRGSDGLAKLSQMALAKAQVAKTMAEAERIKTDTMFQKETFGERSKQIDLTNDIKKLDARLRKADISKRQAETIRTRVQTQLDEANISAKEKEAALKAVQAEIAEYNLAYSRKNQGPVPFDQTAWVTIAKELASALRDMGDNFSVQSVGDSVRDALRNIEEGRRGPVEERTNRDNPPSPQVR